MLNNIDIGNFIIDDDELFSYDIRQLDQLMIDMLSIGLKLGNNSIRYL